MPQPVWRQVAQLEVPAPRKPSEEPSRWTLALELAPAGKLLKIEVTGDTEGNKRTWTPSSFTKSCSADGDIVGDALKPNTKAPSAMPVPGAPRGALVGRIGGSTADDLPLVSAPGTAAAIPAPPPTVVLFSVGRQCVFSVPSTPLGSLYLGVNDEQSQMAGVQGPLLVTIYESL